MEEIEREERVTKTYHYTWKSGFPLIFSWFHVPGDNIVGCPGLKWNAKTQNCLATVSHEYPCFEIGPSFVSQIDFELRPPLLSLPSNNDNPCDRRLTQTFLILPHSCRRGVKKRNYIYLEKRVSFKRFFSSSFGKKRYIHWPWMVVTKALARKPWIQKLM